MLFDSHAHLISPDLQRYPRVAMGGAPAQNAQLDVDTSAEGLIALMDAHRVAQICAVQRAFVYGYDNRYILDAARQYPERIIPVLVVDAIDASTPAMLRQLARGRRLGGIRLSAPRAQPFNQDWLDSPEALRTWQVAAELGVPVAVIFFRTHRQNAMVALERIARRFPSLPIVIDHVGVPHGTIYDGPFAGVPESAHPAEGAPVYGVDDLLHGLVETRNVYFKITSINFRRLTAAGIPAVSFLNHLIATFGASRLMWGSDIGQTAGTYAPKVEAALDAVLGLAPKDQESFLHGTAEQIYGG